MHRFRISSAKQEAIIDKAVTDFRKLAEHLISCTVCEVDKGTHCDIGKELWACVEASQQKLRLIGIKSKLSPQ